MIFLVIVTIAIFSFVIGWIVGLYRFARNNYQDIKEYIDTEKIMLQSIDMQKENDRLSRRIVELATINENLRRELEKQHQHEEN